MNTAAVVILLVSCIVIGILSVLCMSLYYRYSEHTREQHELILEEYANDPCRLHKDQIKANKERIQKIKDKVGLFMSRERNTTTKQMWGDLLREFD